jgi:polyisoprenoid-binding protein YceI
MKNLKISSIIIFFVSFSAWAGIYKILPEQGQVEFTAIGKPSALKIVGKGEGPAGEVKIENNLASGELSFHLPSLKTGISLRDKHMHEKYLKSDVNPKAIFKFTKADVKNKKEGLIKGTLTLNGESHPAEVHYKDIDAGDKISGEANMTLLLTDYKIDIPKYMGITVAETVRVQITVK